MASCLGLYIENNLIKYAKVSKENDAIKVEAFGIKFYEKIGDAINQIIEETYSQRTPVSINISEEIYNYFELFALMKKSDLEKAIKLEFEAFCDEKGYNPNAFETRYSIIDDEVNKEKVKIIHIADSKIELNKVIQRVNKNKILNISPVAMSIPNIANIKEGENAVIVNIEEKTSITTIINSKINSVNILDEGSQDFLTKINAREFSYSKSYDICKNVTIYTSTGQELQTDDSPGYLVEIMPVLYNIVENIKKILNNREEKISKIYITGTGAVINNIDLYFQEYFPNSKCEILKPAFIKSTGDLNIRDYIEVNSAISLGLMGLGEGIKGINFKKQIFSDQLPDWMKIQIPMSRGNAGNSPSKLNNLTDKIPFSFSDLFKWDLGEKFTVVEKNLLRIAIGMLLLVIVYSVFACALSGQIQSKSNQAQESINNTNSQIKLAQADSEKLKTKISDYSTLIKELEELNNKITDINNSKNDVPNLLNQLMFIIPENVQITSIENTSGSHVVIEAKSNKYEQLGYFKAKIKSDVILNNVVSTAGEKSNDEITIKIEGDLP